jgi:hypothetical protein
MAEAWTGSSFMVWPVKLQSRKESGNLRGDYKDWRYTMKLLFAKKNGRTGHIAFSMLSQPCIFQSSRLKRRLACFVTSPKVLILEKCGVTDE